jgi:hypothetical protein
MEEHVLEEHQTKKEQQVVRRGTIGCIEKHENVHKRTTMQREVTTKEDVFEEQQQTQKYVQSKDRVLEKQH